MEFVIDLLKGYQKQIDRNVKINNLMQRDMRLASQELAKVTALKKAIKILKTTKKI